jgi:peptidoglycan/xylan/chitin deacetylase (PgdA/CDA1 family)
MFAGTLFAQPHIIIKLDDLGTKNGVCPAAPVLDILLKRKIKASIGVIALRLDSTALTTLKKYTDATNDNGEKLFEVWNHGYDHSNSNPPANNREFAGTGYGFQFTHFAFADERVKKLLGLQMHTFGSPYNATDSNTLKVVEKNKMYKVFLLNGGKSEFTNGVLFMNNRVNMESATGQVNYDFFVTQYQKLKIKYPDYMVLQGHPHLYDAAKQAEFNKIIDFLISQKCEFVLPYDYYLSLK